ncbi:hypothetical protein OA530_03445 [Pelagibacteraceae bacterium]|nr:hypothetical protein [Pelagibacteraceae bacterium]
MSELKVDQGENYISVGNIINYYLSNTGKIILYALIPILISFAILAFSGQFFSSKKNTVYANVLVEQELLNNISKSFLFNFAHISEAVKRTNLSREVTIDEKFLQSFDIISGHTDLNVLIDDYISRDFLSLTKQLYFKPEQVDDLRKDLVAQSKSFKIITFSDINGELPSDEIYHLISNLVDVLNESLQIEYDFSNINLKKMKLMDLNNPISSMDVSKINSRLALIREYINILKNDFYSFAPDINLEVYMNDLNGYENLFNFVIQENQVYEDIIVNKLKLDIQFLNKNITALKEKMDKFDTGNFATIVEDQKSVDTSSINADSSFIDTILDLGDKASSSDFRKTYLEDIFELETERTLIERRLEDLQLSTNYGVTMDEAELYLVSSLNNTTSVLNDYIDIVRKTKQNVEVFSLLSFAQPKNSSMLSSNINSVLLILAGSFSLSFLIITIGLIRRHA